MTHQLTTRPNLDHFRGQAKTLLAELRAGDASAARAFIAHLPKAGGMSVAQTRAAGFRLADAQSVIARQSGFASWPQLVRHVEQLRALQGEWHFESLQIDGGNMPGAAFGDSKLLMDGDLFRMESPEATYDGRFSIDTLTTPMQIDITFVEGPEAGNHAYGLFALDDDRLTICLGLVGSSRPTSFATTAGSGHALERLRRASPARPAGVTGGTAPDGEAASAAPLPPVDPADFAIESSPILARLEGTWIPVRLVTNGDEMRADWLAYGSRTGTRNEAKVVFGGQTMLHVKMRIDESATPIAIDYLHVHGRDTGKVSKGIMQWIGDEVCFLMAAPGRERPAEFPPAGGEGMTLSQWKRK
ncbi:MAG TPA: TIGR03067 domain-containing protein [Gemmatimonadaceae bacterium]|nr:TIGR03067 domain-containing protein [Gemmatimonadaceae bacterium]